MSVTSRRRLQNKEKFVFDPAEVLPPRRAPRASVQARLARVRCAEEQGDRRRRAPGPGELELELKELTAKLDKEVAKLKLAHKEEVVVKEEAVVLKQATVAVQPASVKEAAGAAACVCARPRCLGACL